MQRTVQAGTFYRHFKDKLYQIITIACHSETGEPTVVYQALYGDYKVYVRPLDMFLSEVDHEKYPDCLQQYRFEQVELKSGSGEGDNAGGEYGNSGGDGTVGTHGIHGTGEINVRGEIHGTTAAHAVPTSSAPPDQANTYLLRFLEAETTAAKLEVLETMKGHIDAAQIESICLTLDIPFEPGDVEQQIEGIRKVLKMRRHYDGSRLRS